MSTGIPPHTRTTVRVLGSLALLVIGSVHFQQYEYEFYSSIPAIDPLFLANFAAATALGLFLLSPIRPAGTAGAILDRGWESLAVVLLTLFVVSGHTTLPSPRLAAPDAV